MVRGSLPFSSAEYVSLLVTHLSEADVHVLLESMLFETHRSQLEGGMTHSTPANDESHDTESHHSSYGAMAVIEQWKQFDAGLWGEIARMRAASLKAETDPHWPKMESFIYIEELRRIFQQGNPMQRELQTHDLRWGFLEDIERTKDNQLGQAVVYYLKLQLLERLHTMTHESAQRTLSAIYERVHTQFNETIEGFARESSA